MYNPINDAGSTLAQNHVSGDGTLVLVDASSFGTPPPVPFRATVRDGVNTTIFAITSVSGNTFTIGGVLEVTADHNYAAGSTVDNLFTAGDIKDLQVQATPGGSTGNIQFNNNGTFGGISSVVIDVSGAIIIGNTKFSESKLSSGGTSLTLEQTGDVYGTTQLIIESRVGAAGATFKSVNLDLVDFGFQTSSGSQSNIRFEHRNGSTMGAGNTSGEFQFIDQPLGAYNLPFLVGYQTVAVGYSGPGSNPSVAKFGVNTINPQAMLHVVSRNPSDTSVIVQMAAGQTSDLQQWQDSTGTPRLCVGPDGKLYCSTDSVLFARSDQVANPRQGILFATLHYSNTGVVSIVDQNSNGLPISVSAIISDGALNLYRLSSTTNRPTGIIDSAFANSTDASWTGRLVLYAGDYTSSNVGRREGVRIESDGTQALIGFYGGAAVAKPTISGSQNANAALGSLISAGSSLGLWTDDTIVGTASTGGSTTITLSGDVTGSGTDTITTSIGMGVVTNNMLAGGITAANLVGTDITTVGRITTGTWNGSVIDVAYGGTGQASASAAFNALSPNTTIGDITYYDISTNARLPGNTSTTKKFLTQTGTGSVSTAPTWSLISAGDIPDLSAIYAKSITLNTSSLIFTTPVIFANDGSGNYSATLSLRTQAANTVLAGPTSGAAANPTMRVLVSADIPDLSGIYLTKTNNLSDLANISTARTNLGVGAASRTFGVSGTPVLNATTPPIFLDRGYTCDGVVAACDTSPSGGSATVTLQVSTTGASGSWTTLGTVSISAGNYSGTTSITSSIAANTFVRVQFTSVNSVANLTATLFLKG